MVKGRKSRKIDKEKTRKGRGLFENTIKQKTFFHCLLYLTEATSFHKADFSFDSKFLSFLSRIHSFLTKT